MDAPARRGRGARRERFPAVPPGVGDSELGVGARVYPPGFEPAPVAHEIADGDVLPGDLRAVWAPGHSAGQIALLWPEHGGVLVAADACTNLPTLAPSIIYEDLDVGRETLRQLAALDVDTAVFGHGGPIVGGASGRFRAAFAQD